MKDSKVASDSSSTRRSPRVILDKLAHVSPTNLSTIILGEVTAITDIKMVEKVDTPKSSQASSSSSRSSLKRNIKEEVLIVKSPQNSDVDSEPTRKKSKSWKEYDKEMEAAAENGTANSIPKKITKPQNVSSPSQNIKSASKKKISDKFWYMESCSEDESDTKKNKLDTVEDIKKIRANRRSKLSNKMAEWGLLPGSSNALTKLSSDSESEEKKKDEKSKTPKLKPSTPSTNIETIKKSPFPLIMKEKNKVNSLNKVTPILTPKNVSSSAKTNKDKIDKSVTPIGGSSIKTLSPEFIKDLQSASESGSKSNPRYIKLTAEEAAKLIASAKVSKQATQSLADGRKVTILSPQNLPQSIQEKLSPKNMIGINNLSPSPKSNLRSIAPKNTSKAILPQKIIPSKGVNASTPVTKQSSVTAKTLTVSTPGAQIAASGCEMVSKSLLCRPVMVTKALMCQPIRIQKFTQTEEDTSIRSKLVVPIPIPMVLPLPFPFNSSNLPCPLPLPVPLPVPLLLPTTKQQAEAMIKRLQEMKDDLPSDPLQEELLKIAEAIQETNDDLPIIESSRSLVESNVNSNLKSTFLLIDDGDYAVKFSYGVNAYRQWAHSKNVKIGSGEVDVISQIVGNKRPVRLDLIALHTDELNNMLTMMVNEIVKPNGENYAADSVFYICLGIQQYLRLHGRIDRIFSEVYYRKFVNALDDLLTKYHAELSFEGVYLCRVTEEHLWESTLLGAHDPNTLLFTLFYFNTKYFRLFTLEQHVALSFSCFTKVLKAEDGLEVLQLKKDSLCRNLSDPLSMSSMFLPTDKNINRCPFKLHQFYLTKCKEQVTTKSDIFYLAMESTCSPESPIWFTVNRLDNEVMGMMLRRCLCIKEIVEAQYQHE